MIEAILTGIFNLVFKFIELLLAPINLLIVNMLPDFNDILLSVSYIFELVADFIGFVFDSLLINQPTILFLISYWVFKLTFPLAVTTFKSVLKWYDKLKV